MVLLPAAMFFFFVKPDPIVNSCTFYAFRLMQTYIVK
jgi:hypothetical protein